MNIDNIEQALFIKKRINNNNAAIKKIDSLLAKYPHGDSDGKSKSGDGKIYNLNLVEYEDGSGFSIELTGSLIQTQLLENAIQLLEAQIEKDIKIIESL
jgi:hypothetical protein